MERKEDNILMGHDGIKLIIVLLPHRHWLLWETSYQQTFGHGQIYVYTIRQVNMKKTCTK